MSELFSFVLGVVMTIGFVLYILRPKPWKNEQGQKFILTKDAQKVLKDYGPKIES